MTRKEALRRGVTRYIGKTCAKHGDDGGLRYTNNRSCVRCGHARSIARAAERYSEDPAFRASEKARSRDRYAAKQAA